MTATVSAFPFASLNHNQTLVDVNAKPLYDVDHDPVAPQYASSSLALTQSRLHRARQHCSQAPVTRGSPLDQRPQSISRTRRLEG